MWGNSPPIDLLKEIRKVEDLTSLNILTVGARDARHIVKTLSMLKDNSATTINFHTSESSSECLQESCRFYLEILGNTILTPGTAKFLTKILYQLIDATTETIACPWLNLESLKYKHRDSIEAIFKFWIRAICEGIPIVEYWDRRMRKTLGTRYDYREGVFDWDYHMVLKSRKIPHLTLHEYRFWRNSGISFTWLETDPSRNNPTLVSNITPYRNGFIHGAYMGDIVNGPYLTWAQDESEKNERLRATDKAERQLMKAIYQIKEKKECPEDIIAAHRDQSVLNGTLITEMPNIEIEQEPWVPTRERSDNSDDQFPWIDIQKTKITFHSTPYLERYKNKMNWREIFDVIFVAHNMINYIVDIVPLMKKEAIIVVESRKFLVDVHTKQQDEFAEILMKIANDNGLKQFEPFNPHEDNFCRLIKNDAIEFIL
ncbi:hypothetical protein PV328_003074 [Microctonus aethiopoides]|uniref:Dynein assembly factor 3, axonemal n=1 Tax=Microctonus aethiopoides TaxID=144406 RepID=A0AA39F7L3_9HYME|nr:hypothetical protein PV328_003074 [Microctonus aethiopoides]